MKHLTISLLTLLMSTLSLAHFPESLICDPQQQITTSSTEQSDWTNHDSYDIPKKVNNFTIRPLEVSKHTFISKTTKLNPQY